jgi:hypothetical protein
MAGRIERVVIMVQENHTIDNYFRDLAPFGAAVATGWPVSPNPPAKDQPHDRHAYFEWLTGASTGEHVQFDTRAVLPYYLQLALTGAFLENHCAGFGTNSTANHLLIVGGQSPTLKNPSSSAAPVWDMPSLPGLAEANGVTWRAYAASNDYPVAFYTQLKGSPNVVASSRFISDAKSGGLPALVLLWHNSPNDEHPPANVTQGMDLIWQSVDAVVQGDGWEERCSCSPGTTGAATTTTSRRPRSSTRPTTSSSPWGRGFRCSCSAAPSSPELTAAGAHT